MHEIELTTGSLIRVWRLRMASTTSATVCLSAERKPPAAQLSPFTGLPVETILRDYFVPILNETLALPGDVLVWRGLAPETTPHSAILTRPVVARQRRCLDEGATRLQTKNGLTPETNLSLEQLIGIYGESYNIFRRCSGE